MENEKIEIKEEKLSLRQLLGKILDETYDGHEEGCLHCASINEAVDHFVQDNKQAILDSKF